jgi:ParB family chromosome partitioning protein
VVNEEIPSDDVRVEFVGLDAYESAGGTVTRDLFGEEAYIADSTLLDKLVTAKLNSIAAGLRAEGWAWVDVLTLPENSVVWAYNNAGKPKTRPFTAEEQSRIDELEAKNAEIATQIEAIDEDADDSQDEFDRLDGLRDELLEQLDTIKNGALEYSAALKKKSGAVVALRRHGGLVILRGQLKPNQKPLVDDDGDGGTPPPAEKAKGGLSQAAVDYLYGVRTGILRSQIRQNERQALAALVSAITLGNNFGSAPGAVKIRPQHSFTSPALREGIGELENIGQEVEATGFEELLALSPSHLIAILADLAANHLTVGHEGGELAQILGVKMSDHWTVTEEWLAKQSKAYILGALSEAKIAIVASVKAKGPEIAKLAAPELQKAGWLPEPFREDVG